MMLKLEKYYNKGCQYCPALKLLYVIADIPTQFFIKINITATQITHLSFLSALLSLLCLKLDFKTSYMIFVLLSILFDVADGMVARATNTGSPFGAFYDHFSDKIKISLYFLFFGIIYHDETIWILTYLNLAIFFLITSLNFLDINENQNTESITLNTSSPPQKNESFFIRFIKGTYRSIFMMYANFMLWFIPVVINKNFGIISLSIMLIIQIINFKEIFISRYKFFIK